MKKENMIDQVYTWLKYGCYQRSLHYHNTPCECKDLYHKQLEYVKAHYDVCTPEDVSEYLKTGIHGDKPSIIIGAFDGYRNNYEMFWKLLEEKQMHAWFLLVADFINTLGADQEQVLTQYNMQWVPDEYSDGRYAMNWEEARDITINHTIVNHTATHYRLSEEIREEELQYEILHAEQLFQKKLGKKPDIYSWLGGAWMEKNSRAAEVLRENEYHFLLGYRLEYFDKNDTRNENWIQAVPEDLGKPELDREIRHYEQVIANLGWYSAVPAILPLYQAGHLITDGSRREDSAMASHFAAIANYLVQERNMDAEMAANRALEVLAMGEMGAICEFSK